MTTYKGFDFTTQDGISGYVATLYVKPNLEGDFDECLMSCWENAMDVQDEAGKDIGDEEFVRLALSGLKSMGHKINE